MQVYKNYVDGRWVESSSSKTAANVNPANPDDIIGTVKLSTAAEVEAAIQAAANALPRWRATPAPERGRFIDAARRILQERSKEMASALSREEGKLLREAEGEVKKSVAILEFMAGEAVRLSGETLPSEFPNTFCYTVRQPIGVAAAITPWNFPLSIPCWKIAPALAAGCTVVFKPSTLTPETAQLLVKYFEEAGLPSGVLNLVYGSGGETGRAIVDHPAVRAISFTGSNNVGMKLYRDGASRGKKLQCEMGGKNPVVVLEDADLELAVEGTLQGAFGSTGQRCTATSRVIVMHEIHDRFLARLVERAAAYLPPDNMGPVVDEQQFRTVLEYIAIGKQEGATLAFGGESLNRRGYYVLPTVFSNVRPEMRIAQEEIFGPVLSVFRVSSFEDAMRVANGVRYGLSSSIYSSDPARIFRFIESIETGITHVNSPTIGGEAQLPFGGIKETGIGTREMGRTAIDFYTEVKTVYVDYTGKRRNSLIY